MAAMADAAPSAMDTTDGTRFVCSHCQSTFARREHLTRHIRTHDPNLSHTCTVCGKSFNRSDSYLRHMQNKHGDGPKASVRSRRACFACHAGKIKCDGEKPCHACVKKGIRCEYRLPGESHLPEGEDENMEIDTKTALKRAPSSDSDQEPTPDKPTIQREVDFSNFPPPRSETYINWSSLRIRPDATLPIGVSHNENYTNSYFTHFHHRLPIVHRASYNDNSKGQALPLLLNSINMIGAWLEGSPAGRKYASSVLPGLLTQCLEDISKISSEDEFQQSFPAALSQAVLMNVVFTLYYGKDKLVSRAIMLFNILITALREVDFFNPAHKWVDEKPGYFLIMSYMKSGERQRLLQQLYKVDAYISILRGSPRILVSWELIFRVPSTFSLANTDGLHIWEERVGDNSPIRSDKTLLQMAEYAAASEAFDSLDILIEDVQLSLSLIHSRLCQLYMQDRAEDRHFSIPAFEFSKIEAELNCVGIQLERQSACRAPCLGTAYYGFEDHSQPGWEPIVDARVQTLHFDALIMHRLVSIHLYTDPVRLNLVAKEMSLDLTKFNLDQQKVIGKRRCNTAAWVPGIVSRRALCIAVDIFLEMKSLDTKPLIDAERLDPICYIAVCNAALIVWIHINFGIYACTTCAPGLGFLVTEDNEVNLGPGDSKIAKEDWVTKSLIARVRIDGVEMCACNGVKILDKFRNLIPQHWELDDLLAPNVFKSGALVSMITSKQCSEGH